MTGSNRSCTFWIPLTCRLWSILPTLNPAKFLWHSTTSSIADEIFSLHKEGALGLAANGATNIFSRYSKIPCKKAPRTRSLYLCAYSWTHSRRLCIKILSTFGKKKNPSTDNGQSAAGKEVAQLIEVYDIELPGLLIISIAINFSVDITVCFIILFNRINGISFG